MTERKFTRSLNKPGMAAQLRETVSQVVRESASLSKPHMAEPIDFENFILKNKTLIQNDPQRELLLYPTDDVSQVILPKKFRTVLNDIPTLQQSASSTTTTTTTSNSAVDGGGVGSSSSSGNGVLSKESSISSPSISSYASLCSNNSSSSSSATSTAAIEDDPPSRKPSVDETAATNNNVNNINLNVVNQSNHGLLLTRQALFTYQSNNHLVHYKYSAYGKSYLDLPKLSTPIEELREEVYEIDADPDRIDEQMTKSQAETTTKQGYLLKGPDSSSDRMFAHIGSKSFKRRYCYLRQEVDGTYILELHKDEKHVDAKATIVMDFCTEVVPNSKRAARFCFELHMTAGHKSVTLAAENETDYQDWLKKLHAVIHQNKLQEDKQAASLERVHQPPPPSPSTQMFGTLKGLEQSMNPQLIKYGRETDVSIAQARREQRKRLFNTYRPVNASSSSNTIKHINMSSSITSGGGGGGGGATTEVIEPYREQFGQRIFIKCDSLKFRLQAPVDGEKEQLCQAEPYITCLALYDAKAGRKLTENFYFDINNEQIRQLFQPDVVVSNGNGCSSSSNTKNATPTLHKKSSQNGTSTTLNTDTTTTTNNTTNGCSNGGVGGGGYVDFAVNKELQKCPIEWLMYPRQSIISITAQHPDIFLVVKIDKILQGGINNSTEAYLKATKDPKLGLKLHKNVKMYNQKIGHFRMPFAWAARPLFRLYSSDLDTAIEFPAIYRQEANRLKDDELLKLLSDYRKPDKFSKLTVIPGWLKITIEPITELPNNCLTTTLSPLKPFPMPPSAESIGPTLEITEFTGYTERDLHPYTTFINHLFIYPLTLNFDSQKLFSRARNIAVVIELRDSDTEGAKPLSCIYGRPGSKTIFLTKISCPVLHHSTNPSWYEEVKLRLPLNITSQHHILFSFVHVSCDLSKKRDAGASMENPVGYGWLPLLSKGKINIDEQCIPVAATLPAGYLSIQPLGLGKGNAGPDIQWIDNQRPLFAVTFRLDSTVLTTDQHLHNLFTHTERLLIHPTKIAVAIPAEKETCKILKAAHAIHITSVITYLPTILNQLFQLLVNTTSQEIGLNIIRLLVNLFHMVADEACRKELLASYVKFVFQTTNFTPKPQTSYSGGGSGQSGSPNSASTQHTVHGELCSLLPQLLHPNNTDFLIVNKFMKYSGIFFDIIVKSMAQHLMATGRIRMHRNERFPKEFSQNVESLFQVLVPYLFGRHKDLPLETQMLNRSLSGFLNRCLTFMDRGFAFKLIRIYMSRFTPGDPRTLQEYKFLFLQDICSHEHYVPLNLPFLLSPKNRLPDILQHFTLSEEFCRQHFLTGLLLQEVKSSLNEVSHIRHLALATFKDLVAKHDLDDRFQSKGQLARIAMLYVPWLGIVLENLNRICDGNGYTGGIGSGYDKRRTGGGGNDSQSIISSRFSCNSSYVFSKECTTPTHTLISNLSSHGTPKLRNRMTLHIDHPTQHQSSSASSSPYRSSLHLKDTNYFAAIAGHSPTSTLLASSSNGHHHNHHHHHSTTSLDSECSTLSQDTTIVRHPDHVNGNIVDINGGGSEKTTVAFHNRSVSVTQPIIMPRLDKFGPNETKDMLICFLFIVKHISPDEMVMWWQNCTESETIGFFTVLDMCLLYFRYVGRKNITLSEQTKEVKMRSAKASTLPARMIPPTSDSMQNVQAHDTGTLNHIQNRENLLEETTRSIRALHESNLATEIGLIILDCMGLYTLQFRDKMLDGSVLPKLARVYLRFLQLGQSETLSKHVFAALRAFINNFSPALFKGNAILCGQLVYELLKCCDSRLAGLRQESCAVLYLLMRSNFEFSGRKGLTRVHLQVIISVSQMIGNVIGLNNARFQESLSMINSYASSDKAMKGTGFPMEVKDLTKRVRTVLMATAQMQAHHMDPERLLELQHSLANSYASTPELRHTWLVTMARNHEQNGNLSEAACCHLHIAALIAEYLCLRGIGGIIISGSSTTISMRCSAESFVRISKNIPLDEKGLKLDNGGGQQDSQYTEQMLLDQLKECAEFLDRAERFECLGELYRLIVPIYEQRRDYPALSHVYEHLAQAYNKVSEVNRSGKRMLGRFYRVIFFGQIYFEEDSGIEYVYKEPKITSLSEISERLHKQYKDKFGADAVKMIMDSSPINQSTLDPKLAYIQITHVTPYFCKDELEARQNEFEQNHDVDTFQFETPFTKSGPARGCVEEQWKRRTILTTQYSFPYVLKRIPVKDKQAIELSPIEVAIDEMQNRLAELEDVVLPPIDVKKLQLRLQGSVAVTVNAGPLAYATAFLDPKRSGKYCSDRVEDLKDVFREFVSICNTALHVNGRMISADQREYHLALKENYHKLCTALADLLDESFLPIEDNSVHRNSIALFSAISGAPSSASTA